MQPLKLRVVTGVVLLNDMSLGKNAASVLHKIGQLQQENMQKKKIN
jgi:hypothetical protein